MTELTVGTKYDQGKLRWDLVPPEFEEVVKVLTYGATKYEDRNWEQGISYGRLIAATLRHLWSWIKGEKVDPETGLHHLAHAGCDILFLLTYEQREMTDFDDRPISRRREVAVVSPSQPRLPLDFPPGTHNPARPKLARSSKLTFGGPKTSVQGLGQPDLDALSQSVHNAP